MIFLTSICFYCSHARDLYVGLHLPHHRIPTACWTALYWHMEEGKHWELTGYYQGCWIYLYFRIRPVILSADWSILRLQSWTCSSLPTVAEFEKLTQNIVIEIQRQSADLYKVQLCNRQFFFGCPSDLRGKGIQGSPAWYYYQFGLLHLKSTHPLWKILEKVSHREYHFQACLATLYESTYSVWNIEVNSTTEGVGASFRSIHWDNPFKIHTPSKGYFHKGSKCEVVKGAGGKMITMSSMDAITWPCSWSVVCDST